MSTSTVSIDCPNCGVSADTGLCDRTTGSVGADSFNDVVCRVCDFNRSLAVDVPGYAGDKLEADEVVARARRELRAFGVPDPDIAAMQILAVAQA